MGDLSDFFIEHMLFGEFEHQEPSYTTCNRCHMSGLEWHQRPWDGAWRLYELDLDDFGHRYIHVCDVKTYGVDLSNFLKEI